LASVARTARSFSVEFEPLELIERFPEVYPGLLESGSMPARLSARYDILPIASGERLVLDADYRLTGPHAGAGGFLSALEAWWRSLRTDAHTAPGEAARLPFTGGWLLYLGYELASEIETCLALPPSSDPVVALALRAPAAWLRDRSTGDAWLVAEPGFDALLDEFERRVQHLRAAAPVRGAVFQIAEEDPGKFLAAARRALEYTAAGDVYQTNLSRQWQATASRPVSPVAVYRRLRSTNPSPFTRISRC
jgi:anthranilate synthase component 1